MTRVCSWRWLWLILILCVGRTVHGQGAAAPFPSVCPVALQPGQVASVARSCSNVSIGDKYVCCASALVELRVSLAEASTAFHVSTVRGAACLLDLNSALQANSGDAQANFQTCNITARDIFRASVRSCNGISSVGTVQEILLEQKVDFEVIREACVEASTMCARCRRAVLDATYVLATTGGTAMRSNVLQSCTDLVFLALASNFSQVTASEIGSCLFIPTATPPQSPPPESQVSPSISPSIKDVVPGSKVLAIRSVVVLAICIALTSLALFLLIILVIIMFRRRTFVLCPQEEIPLTGSKLKRMKGPHFRRDCASLFRHFKFQEIQRATDNFSTIIGRGGFGIVYKARFKDGLVAAVKRMNKGTSQVEQGFYKEMELLGRLHHRHLVTLRGYCADHCHERFLVYEYCENGSLKEQLHGAHALEPDLAKPALTWRRRLQIALDVATGLEYLHSFCEPPLCHRDIKSSNILLSEKFTAKIADFGLAQAGRNGDAYFEPVTTEVHGTPGYMDPEYAETEELTEKSDVYSFGVLLLELVTGRRAMNDNVSLVEWAQKYMDNVESKTAFFIDSELERHEYTLDELKSVISIIKQCIQVNGIMRPKMGQIVRRLQYTTLKYSSSQSSLTSGHFVSAGSGVGAIAESEEPEQSS